jgi:hypothetical protein
MTDNAPTESQANQDQPAIDLEALITQLRQKQGNWVDWAPPARNSKKPAKPPGNFRANRIRASPAKPDRRRLPGLSAA